MKGLPMTYNRDLQEDKEGLFDTVDTLLATLDVFTGMVSTLEVDKENMERASSGGHMLATDLADYLVTERGVPFREAHGVVSRLCDYAAAHKKGLDELTMDELHSFSRFRGGREEHHSPKLRGRQGRLRRHGPWTGRGRSRTRQERSGP